MSLSRREFLGMAAGVNLLALTDPAAPPASKDPDPRGPISVPGRRTVVERDGVQAPGYRFIPPGPDTAAWAASWIGLPGAAAPTVLFCREFELCAKPRGAVAHVTADISYRLWVNGRLAARGPADIGMDYNRTTTGRWFYDTVDLRPFLHPGSNVLAAEVFARPLIGWEDSRQPGCFACELFSGHESLVRTDESWSAAASAHWQERDGRWTYSQHLEPAGWRLSGHSDPIWRPAMSVRDEWQPLVRSEIPARMEVVYPAAALTRPSPGVALSGVAFPVRLDTDGGFTVRFDRVLPAFVGITVKGGKGGVLQIEPNEEDAPGYHRAASVLLDGGTQRVEVPFLDSFSVINLRAEGIKEPLEIQDVRAVFAGQPVAYRGSFECSDPQMTRLWHVCRWATQVCLQTHHLDSPHHQEPISDPGDYMILALNNYSAFFQPALVRQDLRKYSWIMARCRNQVFHTSYALLWLRMLMDYYDHTGDEALVRELAPAVFSLLATFTGYRGPNGLISNAPNYMFMDWVEIAGFPCHHPPAVIGQGYMTAFFHRALADGERVAAMVGETGRAANYARLRSDVAAAFQSELWSETEGQYRDGRPGQTTVPPNEWLPADKPVETFSAHVNVLAVLSGIAPTEKAASILGRAISGPNFNCQPYFMHFVFEALATAGLFNTHALPLMKRWKIVEETQSLREMWSTGDLSHGWGTSPLHQFSARVLGVRPLTPGGTRISVEPLPCGLDWASGVVPVAAGDVHVEWRRQGDSINLEVDVPPGCEAEAGLGGNRKHLKSGRHHLSSESV